MPQPVVSVTVCMHNAVRFVGETLESAFAQTFQDFEIIVIDDGSTDGSADLVERDFRDRRLTLVRQRQQTLRMARPVSLAHAKGKYFAILDSDDIWASTKLERQVEAARAAPDAGLIFSDCELIDGSGQPIGRLSDQYDFTSIDFSRGQAHLELLRRGNFVGISTALAPMAAVRAIGGFNYSYQYVNDYDLWLRLARRHDLVFLDEPLAKYRIHGTQFTQRRPDITLPEQCDLLRPILRSSSYPTLVRTSVGDDLLGQHRLAWRRLFHQGRYRLAATTAMGMWRYPNRVRDSARHRLGATVFRRPIESGVAAYHQLIDWYCRCRDLLAGFANTLRRIGRAPLRLFRVLQGRATLPPIRVARSARANGVEPQHIWIDGSSLGREQTGYFNLLSEWIRRLTHEASPGYIVHVLTPPSGRAALLARLGADGSRLRFHGIGWRAIHWSQIHLLAVGWHAQLMVALLSIGLLAYGVASVAPVALWGAAVAMAGQLAILLDELRAKVTQTMGMPRHTYAARLVRFLWRRLPAPRWAAPSHDAVEVLFWRGRFKWRNSRRIAIVQDMTTRTHPELHTEGNVGEFEEFLGYVQQHAHSILTVSEHSKQDIIQRIAVSPTSVAVIPMPIHPQYLSPTFSAAVPVLHGITTPYVVCVGAIEPRKNLRRLVKAFELIKEESAANTVTLVLVGPTAWDPGFREFLMGSDAAPRICMPGFVPLDHLPSLYHFASAVICPSLYEGFGIPVMEAMCSSAVVLASNLSSLPEVLGPEGIQFNPYDTEAIARALLAALALSAADTASYRRQCRERAQKHLSRVAAMDPLSGSNSPEVAAVS